MVLQIWFEMAIFGIMLNEDDKFYIKLYSHSDKNVMARRYA